MTFWKKKKRPEVVGLDIGTSAVKVVELRPKGSAYELGGFGIAHVPAGAIQGGEVKQPDAVQQAIRQALVQGGVQATEAVIGVSGGSVIAKRVNLPKMSESELGESIRWEAEQHIPFDIDDVNIDFQILRQDGPQLEVMLVAVKKGKVQSYADVVEACGLNVVVVDVDVFALETQYQHNEPGQGNEVVALVNIGHETTNTNILQGGMNVYARDIFVGGRQYASTIAQRFDLAPAEAEAIVRGRAGVGELGGGGAGPGPGLAGDRAGDPADARLLRHHRGARAYPADLSLGRLRPHPRPPGVPGRTVGHRGDPSEPVQAGRRGHWDGREHGRKAGAARERRDGAGHALSGRPEVRTGYRGDQNQPAPTGSACDPHRARGGSHYQPPSPGSAPVFSPRR